MGSGKYIYTDEVNISVNELYSVSTADDIMCTLIFSCQC